MSPKKGKRKSAKDSRTNNLNNYCFARFRGLME
jgi:hypothetical protein